MALPWRLLPTALSSPWSSDDTREPAKLTRVRKEGGGGGGVLDKQGGGLGI